MDEIRLSPEAAVLASRIRTIDRDLDELEQETLDSIIRGLHNSGGAMAANLAQSSADNRRTNLLGERADLVRQLREKVGAKSEAPSS